jgi:hypothetical protein
VFCGFDGHHGRHRPEAIPYCGATADIVVAGKHVLDVEIAVASQSQARCIGGLPRAYRLDDVDSAAIGTHRDDGSVRSAGDSGQQ